MGEGSKERHSANNVHHNDNWPAGGLAWRSPARAAKGKRRPKAPLGSRRDRLYALLRRRRNTPKATRAEPSRASEAGSGTGGVTAPTTRLSLQLIAPATPPATGCWQLCASVTGVPRSKPAG